MGIQMGTSTKLIGIQIVKDCLFLWPCRDTAKSTLRLNWNWNFWPAKLLTEIVLKEFPNHFSYLQWFVNRIREREEEDMRRHLKKRPCTQSVLRGSCLPMSDPILCYWGRWALWLWFYCTMSFHHSSPLDTIVKSYWECQSFVTHEEVPWFVPEGKDKQQKRQTSSFWSRKAPFILFDTASVLDPIMRDLCP